MIRILTAMVTDVIK